MLKDKYNEAVKKGEIQSDANQLRALGLLQTAFDELSQATKKSIFHFGKQEPVKGVYLYGSVGTGKTFLLDLFYNNLPVKEKLRMHFYKFMEMVQERLREVQGKKNPLKVVAKEIAEKARVICFDEFFVVNIVDAMILGNLFTELFAQGITLITTSNVIPNDLYKDGLQRESFMPAIDLLNKYCQLINVDSGIDYRVDKADYDRAYFYPQDLDMKEMLRSKFNSLAGSKVEIAKTVIIEERPVKALYVAEKAIWFDFQALCGIPRCQRDYLALSKQYDNVFMSGLRHIKRTEHDLINNFVKLVDVFYDASTNLIILSSVPIKEIYTEGEMAFEFQRTESRLLEMQSEGYLAK